MAIHEFSIRDLRNSTSNVLQAVHRNGEAIITNHGKPVARLLPIADEEDWSSFLDQALNDLPEPKDTGLDHELAEMDARSVGDEWQ